MLRYMVMPPTTYALVSSSTTIGFRPLVLVPIDPPSASRTRMFVRIVLPRLSGPHRMPPSSFLTVVVPIGL